MALTQQPFTIEGMKVMSEFDMNQWEFMHRYGMDLYRAMRALPSLPTTDEVDYIKLENGVVSVILK